MYFSRVCFSSCFNLRWDTPLIEAWTKEHKFIEICTSEDTRKSKFGIWTTRKVLRRAEIRSRLLQNCQTKISESRKLQKFWAHQILQVSGNQIVEHLSIQIYRDKYKNADTIYCNRTNNEYKSWREIIRKVQRYFHVTESRSRIVKGYSAIPSTEGCVGSDLPEYRLRGFISVMDSRWSRLPV